MEAIELRSARSGFTHGALADGPAAGELVLLLHGFPETSFEWRATLPALAAAGYRAVAPDQRGYTAGARPADVDAYEVAHLVDDVLGFADALGVDRFHLVGHDWGGFVAWWVAGRHADRVRTLTVASTPHPQAYVQARDTTADQEARSGYMDWFRTPDAESVFLGGDAPLLARVYDDHRQEAAEEYLRVFSADDGAALTGGLNWYRANDFRAAIGPIPVPTLYVWSTEDPALGRDAAEATASFVDGPYRFEVLDGIGHWIPETATDTFVALLVEHLTSNRG